MSLPSPSSFLISPSLYRVAQNALPKWNTYLQAGIPEDVRDLLGVMRRLPEGTWEFQQPSPAQGDVADLMNVLGFKPATFGNQVYKIGLTDEGNRFLEVTSSNPVKPNIRLQTTQNGLKFNTSLIANGHQTSVIYGPKGNVILRAFGQPSFTPDGVRNDQYVQVTPRKLFVGEKFSDGREETLNLEIEGNDSQPFKFHATHHRQRPTENGQQAPQRLSQSVPTTLTTPQQIRQFASSNLLNNLRQDSH